METLVIVIFVIFVVLALLSMVSIWIVIENIEAPSSIQYKYIGSEGTILKVVMCMLHDGRKVSYTRYKKEIKNSLKEALSYTKFMEEHFFRVAKAGRIINFLSLSWIWGYLIYVIVILTIYGWKLV